MQTTPGIVLWLACPADPFKGAQPPPALVQSRSRTSWTVGIMCGDPATAGKAFGSPEVRLVQEGRYLQI